MATTKSIIDFELILKKIEGRATAEEEEFLQQWLEESEEHKKYFHRANDFYQNGSAFENGLDSQAAWNEIKKQTDRPSSKPLKWIRLAASVAASLVLLLGIIFTYQQIKKETEQVGIVEQTIEPGSAKATLILNDGKKYDLSKGEKVTIQEGNTNIESEGTSLAYTRSNQEATEETYNTLVIPKGGEFYVELSDGTKVWLNAGSTFKYPTNFIGQNRVVELSGEAYLQVARDESRPFLVKSAGQTIQVLGTEFNVSAYPDDDHVVTTLVEGKVRVSGDNMGSEQVLLPNHQSIMEKTTGDLSQKAINPQHYVSWRSGNFYFQDNSLDQIMKVLARWYAIDVFYDNEAVRNVKFTGGFKRYDSFEKVQQLIEKTNEVKFKISGKAVVIK
ncbi:MAG: DUF4974 domain-containing protein [Cyclobacteriaceae bacterium]